MGWLVPIWRGRRPQGLSYLSYRVSTLEADSVETLVLRAMLKVRSNRRGIYVALGIVLVATTGVCFDTFRSLQHPGAEMRWLPFLGLLAVAAVGMWVANRLSHENEQLLVSIKALSEQLEGTGGEPYREPAQEEQAALDATFKLNERLSLALIAVGFFGGVSLAVTLLTSVDKVFANLWATLAVVALAALCMGLAAWWVLANRRLLKIMGARVDDTGKDEDT